LQASFELDGSDLVVDGTVLDIGANGTTLPGTPLLSVHTTLTNDALVQSPAILGGFGAVGRTTGAHPNTYLDNFVLDVQKGEDPGSGSSDELEGEDVNQHVRSFRLNYDRHEFLTYQARHVTDPVWFPDHTDRNWHADGTRHIDHGNLVIAIHGTVDGVAPTPGQSPSFDFHILTTPADDPTAPVGTPVVLAGTCGDTTGPPPPDGSALCGGQPATGCLGGSTKSRVSLRDRTGKGRDQLEWTWESNTAMDADTETPPGNVALCMYDESEPGRAQLFRSLVPGEASCRNRRGGVKCRRRGHPSAHNTMSVLLRTSRKGRTSLVATAEGPSIDLPAMPLPLPLRVQLQTAHAGCWEATYTAHDGRKNTPHRFVAHN